VFHNGENFPWGKFPRRDEDGRKISLVVVHGKRTLNFSPRGDGNGEPSTDEEFFTRGYVNGQEPLLVG
jgi:hypothetical protein